VVGPVIREELPLRILVLQRGRSNDF